MKGFSELAYDVFGRDIYRPETSENSDDDHPSFKDPRFATAIGLIRYAQILDAEHTKPLGFFGKLFGLFWPTKNK
jgi:cell division protein FtsA